MTISIIPALRGQRTQLTKCWAHLFKITRRDGVIMRMTDHDATLWFKEGGTTAYEYSPLGAPNMNSQRWTANWNPDSSELEGFFLESDGVEQSHIREGRYDRAQIDVYVVDWRWPWIGSFRMDRYWFHDFQYSEERWATEIRSLAEQTSYNINRIHNKRCDADLGDDRCGVSFTGDYAAQTGTVTTVDALVNGPDHVRMRFEGSGNYVTHTPAGYSAGILDTWYRHGSLVWTTGDNVIAGSTLYEVQYFSRATGCIQLWVPTRFDIGVGDTFQVYPGCDKSLHGHCRKKFNNIIAHRGFSYMPTYKYLLKTPRLRFMTLYEP